MTARQGAGPAVRQQGRGPTSPAPLDAIIVAGEPSGDLLAARVIRGLEERVPEIVTRGIGGPAMVREGFDAWHAMDALAVFGYVDALKRAPRLIRIWRGVRRRALAHRPAVFVGVDAPDFNLRLEEQLRSAGIPTVHFVSPSIWAWRFERIHQIRRAVSHMLVLFPFEEKLYREQGIPVTYVGHPLADPIPLRPDRQAARARLGLAADHKVLALMPGSRESEIRLLAPRFLEAARRLREQDPELQIIVPMVDERRRVQFATILARHPLPGCRVLVAADVQPPANGDIDASSDISAWPVAWHALAAADAVLVASGTATLEAALFKRPMVISYVVTPWMRRIMAWRSGQQAPYLPWVGLPNILEHAEVVPELLQEAATPEALAAHVWEALTDDARAARLEARFTALHHTLRRDTPGLAAQAILEVCHAGR